MRHLGVAFRRARWSRPRATAVGCFKQPCHAAARYSSSASEPATPPSAALQTTKTPPVPPTDHRQIAEDQRLFTGSIYAPGSPLFEPHGAHVFNKIVSFLRAQYKSFGFEEVITPSIYKKSLWEKSGHWDNYAEDMFSVTGRGASGTKENAEIGEDEVFGLKPMNCPGHCLLFAARERGYKHLPIRFADFSALHRNEVSGALSGLTRVRRFHQDDGHIFCRPSQVSEEVSSTLEFVAMVYKTFKLPPFKLVLSTRPKDHYIGTVEEWILAEDALKRALVKSGHDWTVNEGDGAFYGPKIDIILADSDGKEHQTATIQLDFQLPQRFNLHYNAPAPEIEQMGQTTVDPVLLNRQGRVTPVIIHRAIIGSLERFMALLMEHYKGVWPFWLSPQQATVLTAGTFQEEMQPYAQRVASYLSGATTRDSWARRVWSDSPDGVRPPQPLDMPSFSVHLRDDDKPFKHKKKSNAVRNSNILVMVRHGMQERNVVAVDFTRQPNQEGLDKILKEVLTPDEYLDQRQNPEAAELSPTTVYKIFLELSQRYE